MAFSEFMAAENQTTGIKAEAPEKKLLHQFEKEDKGWFQAVIFALVIVLLLGAGGLTGFFLARRRTAGPFLDGETTGEERKIVSGPNEVGIKDETAFPDDAEGRLEINDFSQVEEGSHKLIRPYGESQAAYLSSTVIDLNQYVGQCVKVWGETFSARQAGWFLDVGRLKVLDRCPEGI
ncbi:MAG: hypothetical protein JW991_03980 [Candidatus Pacebacteria bacterium]|nr:hypothetical protein [Candidatus Paceibacterota bacterium]